LRVFVAEVNVFAQPLPSNDKGTHTDTQTGGKDLMKHTAETGPDTMIFIIIITPWL
jgi:hypothetical protein